MSRKRDGFREGARCDDQNSPVARTVNRRRRGRSADASRRAAGQRDSFPSRRLNQYCRARRPPRNGVDAFGPGTRSRRDRSWRGCFSNELGHAALVHCHGGLFGRLRPPRSGGTRANPGTWSPMPQSLPPKGIIIQLWLESDHGRAKRAHRLRRRSGACSSTAPEW